MRHFYRTLALLFCATICWGYLSAPRYEQVVILFTNDTHSQVMPEESGRGGYAHRMGLIAEERKAHPDLLLLDAGDFSQGTPYFNYFHGRVEIDAMNQMGYHAATLGNHEFDNGLDTLAMILRMAQFPVVCANYDVRNTPLEGLVQPYTIVERKGCKIGIFGIGVAPDELIAARNFEPVRYLEPYTCAQQTVDILREQEHCDLVICLSHQGTYSDKGNCNDRDMIACTSGIDIVIGGHTHQLYQQLQLPNKNGQPVEVAQMGKAGRFVGKTIIDLAR